jgi:hypothetical protein
VLTGHSKQHIWSQCGTVSLPQHLTAHRLRWLGHVLRMGEERYPYQALFSLMHDACAAPRGAPPMSWEKCVMRDLQALGQPTNMHDLKRVCALRGPCRSMLYRVTHPRAVLAHWSPGGGLRVLQQWENVYYACNDNCDQAAAEGLCLRHQQLLRAPAYDTSSC